MANNEDHDFARSGDFYIGQLAARVTSLEDRSTRTEKLQEGMDRKLDDILIVLAANKGGNDKIVSLARYGLALLAAIGSVGGIIVAGAHFLLTSIAGGLTHG